MTDGQLASPSWFRAPIWVPRTDFYYSQTVTGLLMWGALSNERTGLLFTIAAGPRQCSHSQFRVPRVSWPYFTVSDLRLPQLGGSGPPIYIPQEQGGLVILPGTGFRFRCLLWLAGLSWKCLNPSPGGGDWLMEFSSSCLLYSIRANPVENAISGSSSLVCICCCGNQLSRVVYRLLHSSRLVLLLNYAVVISHCFLLKAAHPE
jgi:hypothetical protein